MKKDIKIPAVEDIIISVVQEINPENNENVYNVYLINLKSIDIENVLVTSKGYGENKTTGEKIKTSVLRHSLGTVKTKSFVKIEPIIEEVFGLSNEYWLSFYENNTIFDKKYIFLAESIREENFVQVPLIEKKGVVIR